MVNKLAKPWLFLPAKTAHQLAPVTLNLWGHLRSQKNYTWSPFKWKGLEFTNPLGIAGGVDKNVENIKAWWTFGPGFIEVGTITPEAQGPNPGQIIGRDLKTLSVWNKLGFPNKGLEKAVSNFQSLDKVRNTPIFANIGKNRTTQNDKAQEDYLKCISALSDYVDAFVINISSPNTKGLRELLKPENLRPFLKPLLDKSMSNKPMLLKLSPDVSPDELKQILDISSELNVDGWIFTNTTASRDTQTSLWPNEGGVSGKPLAPLAKNTLEESLQHLGSSAKDKLIVSTGGIMSPEDVFSRLRMGANLVQVYSTLIFQGPLFFRNVADKATAKP